MWKTDLLSFTKEQNTYQKKLKTVLSEGECECPQLLMFTIHLNFLFRSRNTQSCLMLFIMAQASLLSAALYELLKEILEVTGVSVLRRSSARLSLHSHSAPQPSQYWYCRTDVSEQPSVWSELTVCRRTVPNAGETVWKPSEEMCFVL